MPWAAWQDLETRKRAPLYQKKQEEELRAAGEKAAEAGLRAQEAELRCKEAKVGRRRTVGPSFTDDRIIARSASPCCAPRASRCLQLA